MLDNTAQVTSHQACLHCGQGLIGSAKKAGFCCSGCQVVFQLVKEQGLDQFYNLKPPQILPLISYFSRQQSFDWLDDLEGLSEGFVRLRVEGIQCAACIWLMEKLAQKHGPAKVSIHAGLGQMTILFDPQQFQLSDYVQELSQFGYQCGPFSKTQDADTSSLLLRLGICLAIAMNAMFFSISGYLGLGPEDRALYEIFHHLNFFLSLIAVIVGGSYFFNRAYQALSKRILHFDLPIALGILATFVGSSYFYFQKKWGDVFFDTLTVFIALMLLGRYLQQKFLEKNRRTLMKEDSLAHLLVTCLNREVHEKPFLQIKTGDHLLIQPGHLVPVPAKLLGVESIECSLQSISGEPHPIVYHQGDKIPAGARLLSQTAMQIRALDDFSQSQLSQLLVAKTETSSLASIWAWVAKWYVLLVLSTASLGGMAWLFLDSTRALFVFVSILVVTCPCSLGISIPLARTLANKALLTRGIIALKEDLLDKWLLIQQIFCDKTGTLTLSSLKLANPECLKSLSSKQLSILFNAAARSRHPASQAIYQHLLSDKLEFCELAVTEKAGQGLVVQDKDSTYFIGKPAQQQKHNASHYEVVFSQGDHVLATINLTETVLSEAQTSVQNLKAQNKDFYLVSGDKKDRVLDMGQRLGLPASHVYYECSPQKKSQIIAQSSPQKTVMIGDGLNDALAFKQALLSGAPIGERSPLSDHTDFLFVSDSLKWLPDLFTVAKHLHKVIRVNLGFSAFYNLTAVSLALVGLVSPVVCAIIMPVGSITIIAWTTNAMRKVL